MLKVFFLFFLLILGHFSESAEIIRVGLVKDKFTSKDIESVNFNDIIIQMLEEMGMVPEVTFGSLEEINRKFFKKEINLIFPAERNKFWNFPVRYSENVYPQELYLASNKIDIRNIGILNEESIYITKNENHRKYLEKKLEDNEIQAEIIEVDDISEYSNNITVQTSVYVHDMKYTHMIGKIPLTVFAYNGKEPGFMEKLNTILYSSYREKFSFHRKVVEKRDQIDLFKGSLTEEEKEYLKELREIRVAYEENSTVSHYVPETGRYSGVVPFILEEITEHLDLELKVLNRPYEQWDSLLEKFNSKQIDCLGVVKLKEREDKYIFSDRLTDIHTYKIKSLNYKPYGEKRRLGIIEDAVEEYIAKDYYNEDEIIKFKNAKSLAQALRENKISSALHVNSQLVGDKKFTKEVFYIFPMNLAFHKEDEMLRNIFNKAYRYIVDKDLLTENLIESEKRFSALKIKEAELFKSLWYKGIVFFLIFIMFVLVMFIVSRRRRAKKIEEIAFLDYLTGLGNRYSFEKACNLFSSQEGVALVIDLDNFKKANDLHGHSTGDEVIRYCGNLLKNIFGDKNAFRISGDEYYIFTQKEKFAFQIEKLKEVLEKSEILKKYSIDFSMGYFIKTSDADIQESFKFADKAMYQAKNIKGDSIFEASKEFVSDLRRKEQSQGI